VHGEVERGAAGQPARVVIDLHRVTLRQERSVREIGPERRSRSASWVAS
jgi:hypothetical protein